MNLWRRLKSYWRCSDEVYLARVRRRISQWDRIRYWMLGLMILLEVLLLLATFFAVKNSMEVFQRAQQANAIGGQFRDGMWLGMLIGLAIG